MKHRYAVLLALVMVLSLLSVGVQASAAGEDYIYGMMNIPYSDFYAAEGIAASEVDAVTTATPNKWSGDMTTGAYNSGAGENGYGAILGVKYPVAITPADLETLNGRLDELRAAASGAVMVYDGEGYNEQLMDEVSYAFTELEEIPAAYKTVSFTEDGDIRFSKINGPVHEIDASQYEAELNADFGSETNYGEYQMNFNVNNDNNFPVSGSGMAGVNNQTSDEPGIALTDGSTAVFQIKGVMILTDGANSGGEDTLYALRQMENIWVGGRTGLELSWSAGLTETVHGASIMDTVHYAPTMGETVKQIIFISDDGYYTLDWELFLKVVPDEDDYTLAVADAPAADGETAVTLEGLPEDFEPAYAVEGLDAKVEDGSMTFESAVPGEYTLKVSDSTGKYATVSTRFMLTTDEMPAVYDKAVGVLAAAEGYTADDLGSYIDAIQLVSVNGQDYSARGHGSLEIILSDGTVDTACGAFDGAGEYELTVTAAGYETPLTFTVTVS